MGTNLHQVLRSLCLNTHWNYAIFWKLKHRARMYASTTTIVVGVIPSFCALCVCVCVLCLFFGLVTWCVFEPAMVLNCCCHAASQKTFILRAADVAAILVAVTQNTLTLRTQLRLQNTI